MFRNVLRAAVVVCVTAGFVGCGSMQKGETQIKYTHNEELPGVISVGHAGDYALYTTNDMTPQVVQHLEAGDKLGFTRDEQGGIRAVAGSYSKGLPASTMKAFWKKTN